jgi:Holliday junction DNA helicase RuvA
MFYYINGELITTDVSSAVIDCGGIAYKLSVSSNTLSLISTKKGEKVKLYTHLVVKEDALDLIGFISTEEMSSFKMLISVSGIGAKSALSVLSLMTPEKFALAVTTEDAKAISKAQGVGSKTAARIILELKDKISKEILSDSSSSADNGGVDNSDGTKINDARNTLLVLGYTRSEAFNALQNIDITSLSLEDIIRAALKKLGR